VCVNSFCIPHINGLSHEVLSPLMTFAAQHGLGSTSCKHAIGRKKHETWRPTAGWPRRRPPPPPPARSPPPASGAPRPPPPPPAPPAARSAVARAHPQSAAARPPRRRRRAGGRDPPPARAGARRAPPRAPAGAAPPPPAPPSAAQCSHLNPLSPPTHLSPSLKASESVIPHGNVRAAALPPASAYPARSSPRSRRSRVWITQTNTLCIQSPRSSGIKQLIAQPR
jgi:hypothetical protein